MGRETDDEREARLKQAGAWLEAELKQRGWTQKHLGEQLGVAPQQISAYANGRYEIDPELARDLARLFGLSEYAVWKGMRIALPAPLSDPEAIARAWELAPEVMQRITGEKPPNPTPVRSRTPNRRTGVTRPGERRPKADSSEESAV